MSEPTLPERLRKLLEHDGFRGGPDKRKRDGKFVAWCSDCSNYDDEGHDDDCVYVALREAAEAVAERDRLRQIDEVEQSHFRRRIEAELRADRAEARAEQAERALAEARETLHRDVMNLPCGPGLDGIRDEVERLTYVLGHKDARHAAAERIAQALAVTGTAQTPRSDHVVKPLHEHIIDWFELSYGYNPDPSVTPNGEILRWALQRRQQARVSESQEDSE